MRSKRGILKMDDEKNEVIEISDEMNEELSNGKGDE